MKIIKNSFLCLFSFLFLSFFPQITFGNGGGMMNMIYSNDSSRFATIMELSNGDQAIFLDGKQYVTGSISEYSLLFLSDNTLSYVELQDNKSRQVVGDIKGEWCDTLPVFSELKAKKDWVYTCKKDDKYYAYTKSGNVYGPSISDIGIITNEKLDKYILNIKPSEDSLYLVISDGRKIKAENGEKIEQFDFFGKKSNIMYILKKDGKERLVIEEKNGPEFDAIELFTYSNRSNTYAYFGVTGSTRVFIVNGKEMAKNINSTSSLYFYYPKNSLVAVYKTGTTWNVYFRNKFYTNLESSEQYFSIQLNDLGNLWSAFATRNGVSGIYLQGKWIPKP